MLESRELKTRSWRGDTVGIDKELLDILVCPKCKGDLDLTKNEDGLICQKCSVKYPVQDDIPILLIDEAQPLD